MTTTTLDREKLLDNTGWTLLRLLQENARLSFAELGKRVGLSAPAVAERVHCLEDAGIITGYRAEVSPAQLGLSLTAFMQISAPWEKCKRFAALAQQFPEVLECHEVTGSDSYIAKVVVASVPHLAALIERLRAQSEVTTAIVLASPVAGRFIGRELVEAAIESTPASDRP